LVRSERLRTTTHYRISLSTANVAFTLIIEKITVMCYSREMIIPLTKVILLFANKKITQQKS